VVELEPGVYLPESNAIICYLADASPLLPADRLLRARVLAWLFFEQYSHEPYIAVARFLCRFHPDPESQRALLESKMPGGYRALEVIEKALADAPFLVGGRYTIADIALYAYTHVADEGGFDLRDFPRSAAGCPASPDEPGYVPMVEP
jgi:Glutathione S-transferase